MPADNAFSRYLEVMDTALKKVGVNPHLHSEDYRKMLEDVGFVDVKTYTFKVPAGGWAKKRSLRRYVIALEGYFYPRALVSGVWGIGTSRVVLVLTHKKDRFDYGRDDEDRR